MESIGSSCASLVASFPSLGDWHRLNQCSRFLHAACQHIATTMHGRWALSAIPLSCRGVHDVYTTRLRGPIPSRVLHALGDLVLLPEGVAPGETLIARRMADCFPHVHTLDGTEGRGRDALELLACLLGVCRHETAAAASEGRDTSTTTTTAADGAAAHPATPLRMLRLPLDALICALDDPDAAGWWPWREGDALQRARDELRVRMLQPHDTSASAVASSSCSSASTATCSSRTRQLHSLSFGWKANSYFRRVVFAEVTQRLWWLPMMQSLVHVSFEPHDGRDFTAHRWPSDRFFTIYHDCLRLICQLPLESLRIPLFLTVAFLSAEHAWSCPRRRFDLAELRHRHLLAPGLDASSSSSAAAAAAASRHLAHADAAVSGGRMSAPPVCLGQPRQSAEGIEARPCHVFVPLGSSSLARSLTHLDLNGVDLTLELSRALAELRGLQRVTMLVPGAARRWVSATDTVPTSSHCFPPRVSYIAMHSDQPTLAEQMEVFTVLAELPHLTEVDVRLSRTWHQFYSPDMDLLSSPSPTLLSWLALEQLVTRPSSLARQHISSASPPAAFELVSYSVDVNRRDCASGRQQQQSPVHLPPPGSFFAFFWSGVEPGAYLPVDLTTAINRASVTRHAVFRRCTERAQSARLRDHDGTTMVRRYASACPFGCDRVDSKSTTVSASSSSSSSFAPSAAASAASSTPTPTFDDFSTYLDASGRYHFPPFQHPRPPHLQPRVRLAEDANGMLEEEMADGGAEGMDIERINDAEATQPPILGPNRLACPHQLHQLLFLPFTTSSLTSLDLTLTWFHPKYLDALKELHHSLLEFSLADRIVAGQREAWSAHSDEVWATLGHLVHLRTLRMWFGVWSPMYYQEGDEWDSRSLPDKVPARLQDRQRDPSVVPAQLPGVRPELNDRTLQSSLARLTDLRSVTLADQSGVFRRETYDWLITRPHLTAVSLIYAHHLWSHLAKGAVDREATPDHADMPLPDHGEATPPVRAKKEYSGRYDHIPSRIVVISPLKESERDQRVCALCGCFKTDPSAAAAAAPAPSSRRNLHSLARRVYGRHESEIPCIDRGHAPHLVRLADMYTRELRLGRALLAQLPSSWRTLNLHMHVPLPDGSVAFLSGPPSTPEDLMLGRTADTEMNYAIMRWALLVQRAAVDDDIAAAEPHSVESKGRALTIRVNGRPCDATVPEVGAAIRAIELNRPPQLPWRAT